MRTVPAIENRVYQAVLNGELRIDTQGRVWRLAARRWDRWVQQTRTMPCEPRRAEHNTGSYLQVRVMFHGQRAYALAHRLVWRHFRGPIPEGLTINHRNGVKQDNRPENLELATDREQVQHARQVLRRGRLDQWGENNPAARLTTAQVQEICRRRANGETLTSIAAYFRVAPQTISKIARGDRRSLG